MSAEIDSKIESILISVVNRLFEKEGQTGLDLEDLRCFEIVAKIHKDSDPVTPTDLNRKGETDPDLLVQLVKRARSMNIKNDPSAG